MTAEARLRSYSVEAESLSASDVREVAAVHRGSLEESFVNALGPRFVELLFGHMHRSRFAQLVAVRERCSGRVVGHMSAAIDVRRFYLEFLWRHGIAALRCAPFVLAPRRSLRKAFDTLSYPFRPTVARLPRTEILTMSIAAEHRGRRLLGLLHDEIVQRLMRGGAHAAKIVTAGDDDHVHRFLERRGWRRVHTLHIHPEDRASCIHVATWGQR